MANEAKFCQTCGQLLVPGLRFCEQCGHSVSGATPAAGQASDVPIAPPEVGSGGPLPPQRQERPTATLPWIIAVIAVIVLCLVLAGAATFYFFNSSRFGQVAAAVSPTVASALPAPETRFAATGTPTGVSLGNTVTVAPTSPPVSTSMLTITPTSTATSTPTGTSVPTVSANVGSSGYDLYVRRIDYLPAGPDLVAGKAVRFTIMIATDTYPAAGPYFPTSRFRWRPGDGTLWAEALCPANTQNANCTSNLDYTYTQPGTYAFEIEVDNRSEVVESNENNNTGRVTVQVNAAPIPTAALPAGPAYSAVTFSTDFDQINEKPVNPGKTFPYGPNIIYSWWIFSGVAPGTEYTYTFYKDGSLFFSRSDRFTTASGNAWQWMFIGGSSPPVALEPATYSLSIIVNNKIVVSGSYVIQPPAVGGPIAGAFSVFFTVQNGVPTGWVYDKQGIRHSPSSGTISNLHVLPGDRIVLQTDQARFSLLFDCSTTPGTFNPCDFMSDSTGNLPKEIRAVKSGLGGYLNISRADNWAGQRPGFPGQRYPADPVLRIVFSW